MIYKVSYVVRDRSHPGAILDADEMPKVGDTIDFGGSIFVIEEVVELMPARGGFGFLHATVAPLRSKPEHA